MSSISAFGESWPSRNGRMERNFPVFRFSGVLGQIREIRPKFRNEIPEKDCSIRSPHPEFPEHLSNGKHHAIMPKISDILVGIQMERSVSVFLPTGIFRITSGGGPL